MSVPAGYNVTNSGGMVFVYNNLQAALQGETNANANAVFVVPTLSMLEPQAALFMTARNPGGSAYRQPTNAVFPNTTNPCSIIGGDFGVAAARQGYTKGAALLIASNSNGTTAKTFDTTNTQANTNSFAGDLTFATINVIILQNLSGCDGISNGAGAWFVNGSATNGAVLNLNTNGTYVVNYNGGCVVIEDNVGINSVASTCKVLCTPVNGGVLAVAIYGS